MAALETIISGACWSDVRINISYPDHPIQCTRCGAAYADAFHTFWECPCNEDIQDEDVAKTQYLIPTALVQAVQYPCMWLRGILPASLMPTSTTNLPENRVFRVEGQVPNPGQWPSGHYFGDGSGGRYSTYKQLRRCGVGLCKMQGEVLQFGVHYTLPGIHQTVPRSEVSAFATLLEMLAEDSWVVFITDNLPLHKTFHQGPDVASKATNHDLYRIIFRHIESKRLNVTLLWMPSHLDTQPDKEKPDWVTDEHIIGNKQADRLAGISANMAEVDMNAAAPVLFYSSRIKKIQRRLVGILLALPPRGRVQRPPAPPRIRPDKPSLDSLLAHSEHIVYLADSGSYNCVQCRGSMSDTNPLFRDWICEPCLPSAKEDKLRPSKIIYPVQVGSSVTHSSHKLFSLKGLIYCNKCGYLASQKLHNLALPCPIEAGDALGKYGHRNLQALRNGKLPPGQHSWPEDSSSFVAYDKFVSSQQQRRHEEQVLADLQLQCSQMQSEILASRGGDSRSSFG